MSLNRKVTSPTGRLTVAIFAPAPDRSVGREVGVDFEVIHVAVPGGEIFATRRGAGSSERPAVLLLHRGPGLGAESMVGLVEELDGLIDGVLPQQRVSSPGLDDGTFVGLPPRHAYRGCASGAAPWADHLRDPRRRLTLPALPA
jgi:hypothetical protein